MNSAVVTFSVAFVVTLLIIRFFGRSTHLLDVDLIGSQKFHARPVPRVGGISIFVAVVVGSLVTYVRTPHIGIWLGWLIVASIPAFAGGLMEDLTKNVSPARRLLLTMGSAALGYILLNAALHRLDIVYLDRFLASTWIAFPLTVIAVAGLANAVNIIDGFNGLASFVSFAVCLSIAYVAWQVGDGFVMVAAFLLAGAIIGFFVFNYPFGLIFLGDGGAYFIGFILAELMVLLVARNASVSAWYPVLALIYPIFETMFSIYRKKFVRKMSPGIPDGVHLHMLIFKRLVRWAVGHRDSVALTRRNSLTSPYLWLLSCLAIIPATLFWQNSSVLMMCCVLFVVTYVWLYVSIVRFRAPRWMILRGKKNE